MEGRVSEVFNYFNAQGMEDHLGYWKDTGKAESPIVRMRKVVTEELTRIKTLQGWAKEKGLIKDPSYTAFKRGLLAENARRLKAVENKEVIYGPTQYKEYRYYYFRLEDLNQALLEAVSKEPDYAIPQADVEAFYNAHKESFGSRALDDTKDNIVRMFQHQKYEERLKERTAAAKVEVDVAVLNGIAPRHDP